MSQRALVARLAEIGQKMNQAAIARIERGERKISLDEAIAIAAALDVAPVHMFLPIEGDERVSLARALEVDQVKARRWARGNIPLDPANFRSYRDQGAGDTRVSPEELSPEEQAALQAENERLIRKLGIEVLYEPTKEKDEQ